MTTQRLKSCRDFTFHCVQLVRPKVPTASIIIKTSCVPSRWLNCKASTGRMASNPLVHTLSHGSVKAGDTARTHIRCAQAARSRIQKKSSIIDTMSCENCPKQPVLRAHACGQTCHKLLGGQTQRKTTLEPCTHLLGDGSRPRPLMYLATRLSKHSTRMSALDKFTSELIGGLLGKSQGSDNFIFLNQCARHCHQVAHVKQLDWIVAMLIMKMIHHA